MTTLAYAGSVLLGIAIMAALLFVAWCLCASAGLYDRGDR